MAEEVDTKNPSWVDSLEEAKNVLREANQHPVQQMEMQSFVLHMGGLRLLVFKRIEGQFNTDEFMGRLEL